MTRSFGLFSRLRFALGRALMRPLLQAQVAHASQQHAAATKLIDKGQLDPQLERYWMGRISGAKLALRAEAEDLGVAQPDPWYKPVAEVA